MHIISYQSKHGSVIDKWGSAIYFKIHFLIIIFRRKNHMLDEPLYNSRCCLFYHDSIIPLDEQTNRKTLSCFLDVYIVSIYHI